VACKAGLAGTLVILTGLVFRSVGTYMSRFGTPFDWKEKLFCVVAYIPKATVQAAIGAIPLAAGVASGEVILAVAVLSILLTAPIGAIGIMFFGERILDYGELSMYRFKELRDKLALPHVGERVRSKVSGNIWKVIEQKEMWLEQPSVAGGSDDAPRMIPAIYIRYWGEEISKKSGKNKTLSYHYTQEDASFKENWEILYDW